MGWYGRKRAVPTEEQKAERATRKAAKAARKAECQICGRAHCLDAKGLIVLHGYQRPGHGWIQGRCYGVGHVDYTRGKEALEAWLAEVIVTETRYADLVAEYDRGEVTHFTSIEKVILRGSAGPYIGAMEVSWAPGVSDAHGYRMRLAARRREVGGVLAQVRMERRRVEKRIADWKAPAAAAS